MYSVEEKQNDEEKLEMTKGTKKIRTKLKIQLMFKGIFDPTLRGSLLLLAGSSLKLTNYCFL